MYRYWGFLLVLFCALLAFSGCQGTLASTTLSRTCNHCGGALQGPFTYPIYFAPSVSYDRALQIVTDLGLQPGVFCGYIEDIRAGRVVHDSHWQPAGQRAIYLHEHRLLVARTPLTLDDWSRRLGETPGVLENPRPDDPIYCPAQGGAHQTALTAPLALPYSQPGSSRSYVRISFASPLSTYGAALSVVSDLGLRLADPCGEASLAEQQLQRQSGSIAWHPMGQEQAFASTYTLIVAPGPEIASNLWRDQLRAVPGVIGSEDYVARCA